MHELQLFVSSEEFRLYVPFCHIAATLKREDRVAKAARNERFGGVLCGSDVHHDRRVREAVLMSTHQDLTKRQCICLDPTHIHDMARTVRAEASAPFSVLAAETTCNATSSKHNRRMVV